MFDKVNRAFNLCQEYLGWVVVSFNCQWELLTKVKSHLLAFCSLLISTDDASQDASIRFGITNLVRIWSYLMTLVKRKETNQPLGTKGLPILALMGDLHIVNNVLLSKV